MEARPHIAQTILGLLALMLTTLPAKAQLSVRSNWRVRTVANPQTSLRLDSLSIDRNSLSIEGVAPGDYELEPYSATIRWKTRPQLDSVRIRYRVLPLDLTRPSYHKDRRLIDSLVAFNYRPTYTGGGQDAFVAFSPLEYTGSYGRSISLGNNQDAALQSHFNLQASGYLPDSISIAFAAAERKIAMSCAKGYSCPLEEMREHHRIDAATQRQKHRLSNRNF